MARAWSGREPVDTRYRAMILVALVFCAAGDIFLMLPLANGFILGLSSFLVAHFWFIGAATRGVRFAAAPAVFAGYAALAGGILASLWPAIPAALAVPVVAYVIVLTCMAAQGGARLRILRSASSRHLAIGGGLFLISDSLLAWDRFAGPLALGRLWVLATYYLAIWFIARSVSGSAARGQ